MPASSFLRKDHYTQIHDKLPCKSSEQAQPIALHDNACGESILCARPRAGSRGRHSPHLISLVKRWQPENAAGKPAHVVSQCCQEGSRCGTPGITVPDHHSLWPSPKLLDRMEDRCRVPSPDRIPQRTSHSLWPSPGLLDRVER